MDIKKEVKYSGILAAFLFLISLYICGYLLTYESVGFTSDLIDNSGNRIDDYSISYSLANGNHAAMTVLFSLGLVVLFYMLYLKFPQKGFEYYLINILVLIIFILVISMIFYSPYENKAANFNNKIKEEHFLVAIFAFSAGLALNMYVAYHVLYKYKLYFWILITLQLGFYLTLMADAEYANYIKTKEPCNTYKDIYFPIAENFNFLFFILTMFLLAFLPLIKKKSKPFKKLSENNIKLNYIKLANE